MPLSLKGIEKPLDLEFFWQLSDQGQARLQGEAKVNRLDFVVGSGSWADDSTIGLEVPVLVDLLLERREE